MKKTFFYLAVFYLFCLLSGILFNELILGSLYTQQNLSSLLESPSLRFWFGTDSLGRDLFARAFHGARNSILIGLISALLGSILGSLIGAFSALSKGLIDRCILRVVDLFSAIPSFMLASAFALYFQSQKYSSWSSYVVLILSITLSNWMYIARIVRGKVLSILNESYIEAARTLGASPGEILWAHVWPNARPQILILLAMQIPLNIIFESMISFIGLGILPPESSLGLLIKEGWRYLVNFPHLLLVPAFLIFFTIWSTHVVLDYFHKMDSSGQS